MTSEPIHGLAAAAAGPLRHATLLVADLQPSLAAYTAIGLCAGAVAIVSAAQADAWGQPALRGLRCVWLSPQPGGTPLLRLIQVPGTPPRPTRLSHGWLALEVLVRDVDALAPRVAAAGFDVAGTPADLAITPLIRAMQAVGPAGEMLYLTQVKAPVPPFDLPLSAALAADIGGLFIGVMSVASREAALQACAALRPRSTLRLDTRVTVLSAALGRDRETAWPLATVQWAGSSLFEIDEVVDARVGAAAPAIGGLPGGLCWLSMDAGGSPPARRLFELAPGVWIEPLAGG